MVACYRFGAVGAASSALHASYGVASAPTRVASRLGLRGLKRQRALAANELWAQRRAARALARRARERHPDRGAARARSTSRSRSPATSSASPPTSTSRSASSRAIGGARRRRGRRLPPRHGRSLIVIVGVVLGASLPYMQISGDAQERLKNVSRGLPYVIDLMALAMGAGLDFPGAVRQVVEKSSNPDDPLVEEFTLILQTLNLGRTRKDALLEFATRAARRGRDGVRRTRSSRPKSAVTPSPRCSQIQADRRRVRVARCAPKSSPRRPASQMVGPLDARLRRASWSSSSDRCAR